MSFNRDRCIEKLRAALLKRGASGLKGLSRAFLIMDDSHDRRLDWDEFKTGLTDLKAGLNDEEIKGLFKDFDADGTGTIDINEFVEHVRPYMSDRRKELVKKAFAKADKDQSGVIEPKDLKGVYNARKHPKYLNGEWTEQRVFEEFLKSFEPDEKQRDGRVTYQEFELYYNSVSVNIDDDVYFDLMMRNAWKI